jgi:hypothetical protein
MGSQPKAVYDGVSKKMLTVIIAMLAIILLPVTSVSLPLSRIALTVSNMDTQSSVSVTVTVHQADDGYFNFILTPGEEHTVSCPVRAGTHDVFLSYWFSSGQDYWLYRSSSCNVWPFETEDIEITLSS